MQYKDYTAQVEYDDAEGTFHGRVIGTRDVITFAGTTVEELRAAFRDSVEEYVSFCARHGQPPEKPHSGLFMIHVGSDLHRRVSTAAAGAGVGLNDWITARLDAAAPELPPPAKVGRKSRSVPST